MANDADRLVAGRYRLIDVLGRGGMGTVWRARDESLHRQVAIKELILPDHLDASARETLYRRMRREARAAAQLKHPAIITVHDQVVDADGRPWIVTEIVDGPSLDEVLRTEGRLPPQRVAAIGGRILAALAVAHAAGITHRDIKPANVLLEGDRVVLTDFGIAAVEGDVTLTGAGTTLGTPAFISPEQINGHPATAASDLWSLGATLYAAVEGRRPFSGTTHGSIYVSIVTRPPAPTVHAGPLAPLLEGLLRKDPARRLTGPQAAEALAEIAGGAEGIRIAGVAATPAPDESSAAPAPGEPSAEPGPRPEPAPRPEPRPESAPDDGDTRIADRPAPPTLAPAPPSSPAEPQATARQEVRPPATLPFTSVSSPAPPPAASPVPEPTRAVARPPRHRRGFRPAIAISAALLATAATVAYLFWSTTGPAKVTEVAQLRGHTERVNTVAFSPGGETLAGGDGDGAVILWDPRTRRPIGDPMEGHTRAVEAMAFSPDGRLLASGGNDNEGTEPGDHTVILWDVATRQPVGDPLTGHTDWVRSVAFSPDGRTLATASADKTVILWDVATRQRIGDPLTGHTDWVQSVAFSPDGRTLATGGDDAAVILWDVATRQRIGDPLTGHTDLVRSVVFAPDGGTLATGGRDMTVILWDVATRRPIGEPLTGHPEEIHTIALGPDGGTLAVGTGSAVRLWDLATRRPIGAPLTGHAGPVWSAAFAPDGGTLATGGDDRTVILWDTSSLTGSGTAVPWPWLAGAGALVVAAAGAVVVILRRRGGRAPSPRKSL
ncbi:WD40 repeat domain-containing serine/threonine protein kinase [Streptosporangium sp. NPDC002721]|uniref:WD40 repeat domain-containing serine/threonine protein kinase n=1 Tax=Streptosporangium sp. NPDC002721 TaxID=3366188 RepID=UPI00369A2E4D